MQAPDNFSYIVPVEFLPHTPENPFCYADPSCECHEDEENIAQVNGFVQEGLMTPEEATDFVAGRHV